MMVEIDTKLYNDIKLYCKTNNLVIKDFVNKLLKKAFMVEKYGETPFGNIEQSKIIQTETDGKISDSPISTTLHKKKENVDNTVNNQNRGEKTENKTPTTFPPTKEETIEKKSKKRKL